MSYKQHGSKKNMEEYCERYFGGMQPKELQKINYQTPSGHNVEALICRKHNRYLGSLLILTVDDEPVEQFVQGMPKIHYLDNYHMVTTDDYMDVYEKLDGTNVCLYGLKDSQGELVEIVPKSRNMGMLDPEFHKLWSQTDTKEYYDYINENPDTVLYFELYGMGNPHGIKHMSTWLDIKLLGMHTGERFVSDREVNLLWNRRPVRLFRIHNTGDGYLVNPTGFTNTYRAYTKNIQGTHCSTMEECVSYMKECMETLNNDYDRLNGRFALEGAVINGQDKHGHFIYIKVKPDTIELAHKSENGIPKQFIMKEVMKYLDEHRSDALRIWEENPDDVMDYINSNLRESFEEPYITKSQGKIMRLFDKQVRPDPTPEEIKVIGDKLLEDYPTKSVKDLMRVFGQEHPELKKSGGKLYRYLEGKI